MISCRDSALKLISFKDRTEKELKDRLSEKGYEENEIEETVEFLKEYKYLDDEKYAKSLCIDCVNIKKWGKSRIFSELMRRGIPREIADAAVAENACDEGSVIAEEIKKRFKNSDLGNLKERSRIFSYFARRGFSPSQIRGAINEVCSFEDIIPDDEF